MVNVEAGQIFDFLRENFYRHALAVVVVDVLTLTRIIKSVVTGLWSGGIPQRKTHKQNQKWYTHIFPPPAPSWSTPAPTPLKSPPSPHPVIRLTGYT